MKNFKIVLNYTLVIFWMGIIFYFSHQPGVDSGNLSGTIMEKVLAFIENFSSREFDAKVLEYLIRKSAHFFVYFVLGILVINALKGSNVKAYKAFVIAFIVSVLYAASDELHQTFIQGRSGELRDIAIDSLGSSFGLLIYVLFKRYRNIYKRANQQ